MRIALIALVAVSQIGSVAAEEVRLRCDPIAGNGNPLLIAIDSSQQKASVDKRLFSNGLTYQVNFGASKYIDLKGPDTSLQKACLHNLTEFVSFSETDVIFGTSGKNINDCGRRSPNEANWPYRAGTLEFRIQYDINRNTGILDTESGTLDKEFVGQTLPKDRYQCQVFTGKVF